MKKILLLTIVLLVFRIADAQFTGKPIYNIRIERADTVIGNIVVEMFPTIAPKHVRNFDSLVNISFYDSLAFHRVVPGFVIQGGDPNTKNGDPSTWGTGQPGQATVDAEFSEVSHKRGIFSAARKGNDINSATSQFFVCVADATHLDGNYSVYGEVISGMDIVDIIVSAPVVSGTERPVVKITMFPTLIGSNDSVPSSPSLISPANNTTNISPTTNFSWTSVSENKLYRFEVAEDAAFNNIVFTKNTIQTNAKVEGLEGFKNYYWRVRANNGGNLSAAAEVRQFTNGIGTPTLISPEDDENVSNYPKLDWQDENKAKNYHVMVSRSSTFSTAITLDTIISFSDYRFYFPLEMNKRYYWKVSAIDSLGNEGTFSAYRSFKVTFEDPEASIYEKSDRKFVLFPNPSSHQIYVSGTDFYALKIYSPNGAEITCTTNRNLDIHQIPNGLYFYEITDIYGQKERGKWIKN